MEDDDPLDLPRGDRAVGRSDDEFGGRTGGRHHRGVGLVGEVGVVGCRFERHVDDGLGKVRQADHRALVVGGLERGLAGLTHVDPLQGPLQGELRARQAQELPRRHLDRILLHRCALAADDAEPGRDVEHLAGRRAERAALGREPRLAGRQAQQRQREGHVRRLGLDHDDALVLARARAADHELERPFLEAHGSLEADLLGFRVDDDARQGLDDEILRGGGLLGGGRGGHRQENEKGGYEAHERLLPPKVENPPP